MSQTTGPFIVLATEQGAADNNWRTTQQQPFQSRPCFDNRPSIHRWTDRSWEMLDLIRMPSLHDQMYSCGPSLENLEAHPMRQLEQTEIYSKKGFDFHQPAATKNAPKPKALFWSIREVVHYVEYVVKNMDEVENLTVASAWTIFKRMSQHVRSKNPNQCRLYHMKLIRKHQTLPRIIAKLQALVLSNKAFRTARWERQFGTKLQQLAALCSDALALRNNFSTNNVSIAGIRSMSHFKSIGPSLHQMPSVPNMGSLVQMPSIANVPSVPHLTSLHELDITKKDDNFRTEESYHQPQSTQHTLKPYPTGFYSFNSSSINRTRPHSYSSIQNLQPSSQGSIFQSNSGPRDFSSISGSYINNNSTSLASKGSLQHFNEEAEESESSSCSIHMEMKKLSAIIQNKQKSQPCEQSANRSSIRTVHKIEQTPKPSRSEPTLNQNASNPDWEECQAYFIQWANKINSMMLPSPHEKG